MTAMSQALSAALLDFVWQGLLMAFLLWIALFILKNRSARARYAACCVALAAMALLPVVTACLVYTAPDASPARAGWVSAPTPAMRAALAATRGASLDWAGLLHRWALPVWSLGVLLCSLRVVWAARRISALRRQSAPAEAAMLSMVAALRDRLKLTRPVRVLTTAAADCPSVVGWMRPVVLLPAATILGLSPQQLEAVLAHELAHILRYDHLVNMLQTMVETLLFYHPAVWWASARVRQERELCCDDLAVAACGDALCYARALTRLERLRLIEPGMALGSSGAPLLYRIRRILGEVREGHAPSKLPGILALSLGLLCLALNMQWARAQQQNAAAPAPAGAENSVPDDAGVQVDLGGAAVLHREGVEYPASALEKRIQGTVLVEATLDAAGMVSDARVLSGAPELRKAALQSVLEWHFMHDAAGSTRQVSIAFLLPAQGVPTGRAAGHVRRRGVVGGVVGGVRGGVGRGVSGGVGGGVVGGVGGGMSGDMAWLDLRQRERAEASEAQAKLQAELAERMNSDRAGKLERSLVEQGRAMQLQLDQTAELEDQLRILRDRQAELRDGRSSLTESQRAEMAELAKHLAELKRMAELQGGMHNFAPALAGGRVKSITVLGLSGPLRDELLSQLPVHVGDTLDEDSMEKVEAAVKRFDEHLGISIFSRDGQAEIRIAAPGSGEAVPRP